MAKFSIRTQIRPIAGADGPFWTITSLDKGDGQGFVDGNVTTALSDYTAAVNQARTDHVAALGTLTGSTPKGSMLTTNGDHTA